MKTVCVHIYLPEETPVHDTIHNWVHPKVCTVCVCFQGDKDFTPAAAQVAHQKPQASNSKLPPPTTSPSISTSPASEPAPTRLTARLLSTDHVLVAPRHRSEFTYVLSSPWYIHGGFREGKLILDLCIRATLTLSHFNSPNRTTAADLSQQPTDQPKNQSLVSDERKLQPFSQDFPRRPLEPINQLCLYPCN